MSTRSLPSYGRVHATSRGPLPRYPARLVGTAAPKLAITELIRSMEAEIEQYIAEHIG
jgi:hypothetical protein